MFQSEIHNLLDRKKKKKEKRKKKVEMEILSLPGFSFLFSIKLAIWTFPIKSVHCMFGLCGGSPTIIYVCIFCFLSKSYLTENIITLNIGCPGQVARVTVRVTKSYAYFVSMYQVSMCVCVCDYLRREAAGDHRNK